MNITLIVAAAKNNAIGKDNQLLWHLPNDMRFFKASTWGLPVIMGRKTFESLNGRPLAGRYNIVISSDADFSAPGITVVTGTDKALGKAAATGCREVMIIGGGTVYEQMLPLAGQVYLTRVHAEISGDTFFPALPAQEWQLLSERFCAKDEKHAHDYSFERWVRR